MDKLKEVVIGNQKYLYEQDDNQIIIFKRYHSQSRMWVRIIFDGDIQPEITERVQNSLKSEYLRELQQTA